MFSIWSSRSRASAGWPGNNSARGIFSLCGRLSTYLRANSFDISFLVSSQVDLLDVVLSGEHNLSIHDFSKWASRRPDVHFLGVLVTRKHNFWSSIVSCDDVLCQVFSFLFAQASAETKVTNFEVAVLIQQDVAWLQVSVNHVCWMQKLKCSQDLIDKVLDVL